MKKILGISAFYHDSSATILVDGKIIAAVQEERFTRIKNTPDFPVQSIQFCLKEAGLTIDDLDAVVFYDKPLLKFERLLSTYNAFAPKGLLSFLKSIPVWINEKMFLKKLIYDGLKEVGEYDKKNIKLLFTEHHLAHAASTFFVSPFEKAAILTIDGVGEWCTASIAVGNKNGIQIIKEMEFPHSVGLLYSAFTYFLGFKVNSGEYKLMGLAPYGNPNSSETLQYINTIRENLVDIKSDGSIWLNQNYFTYSTGLKMVNKKKWELLFGIKSRKDSDPINQTHCNLAFAIQLITQEIVVKMALEAKKITGLNDICLAGGVALNCSINGYLLQENLFNSIYVQPASGDAGGSLGAALAINYMYFGENRSIDLGEDKMQGSYLGPEFSSKEIETMNKEMNAISIKFEDNIVLSDFVASKITEDKIIGWFQGRMEFGPRALGNRSILGDPRNPKMQKILNEKIKFRESFRPFAPSVLAEKVSEYFNLTTSSPFMLFVAPVKNERRKPLSKATFDLSYTDRLSIERSDIHSVTHLDYSARIQTVHKETNPRFWQLIHSFEKQTNYSLLINTSFNVRGEPIVCSPHDAFKCFMNTDMDYLVIGDYVYTKFDQENWNDKSKWQLNFKKD
jgi:carbamoyltransferase